MTHISRSQFALNPKEESSNWKSPLSLVASKYAFGSRVMSSNDSLNMDQGQQHSHDTQDQRVYGAVLASPAVSRRDFGPPQPTYAMPTQAHPQPGKMLVDPQTGQQYFVPAAPQPHVAYYPVFYNAPPQSSQPVYYPHHTPAGYMVSAPPMPSPTVQNQPYYFPPTYNQQGSMGNFSQSFGHPPTSSQGYRVEIPPSSSVSICGERESPTQYFQRHHESRLSTESTNSSNSRHYVQNYVDGAKTDDSMSPVPQKIQSQNTTPPTSSINSTMDHSARYSTTSSSTTSGFVSHAGEGPSEHIRPTHLKSTFQKPQLYGSPAWWGEESSPDEKREQEQTPTRSSNSRQNSRSDEKLHSPTTSTPSEAKPPQNAESPVPQGTDPKPVMKAIRMDIDLSRPFSPEQKEKINVKAAQAVQSTAFTVNFDDITDKPKRNKPPVLSSQEQQRRQFRRSVPPSKAGPALPAAAGNDTKHYLFSKMIQGFPKGQDNNESAMMALSIKSEADTLSEAGTYVIENKEPKQSNHHRRQRKYSSSSSSSSDSTETDGDGPTCSQPTSARLYTPRPETANSSMVSSTVSSVRSSDHQKPSPPFPMKRHLMKDLRDLRNQNQQATPPSPRSSLPAPKVRSMVDQSKNSRLNPPSKPCQTQQTTSRAGISSNAGFRRTDGGRFSMRSGVNQPTVGGLRPATSQTMSQKPPFKAGVAPAKKTSNSKDSPEMVAWLRRKEYDPRKSAAEAKKQQLKQRLLELSTGHTSRRDQLRREDSDNFFANRSLSCNQPTAGSFRRLVRPYGDERSNKSHDDLSHVGEEPDDFSLSGSNSNLVRTVDELTVKCQRSMQLLKLCNPKALTSSVEHLLDEMVEEPGSVDGISAVDRLNRLSEAFGAIQKCLELQQSEKSGNSSPARSTVFSQALRRLTSPTQTDMGQSSSNSEAQSPELSRPIAFTPN
ncbi:unnamed protein product [Bursaphelenchus okinawaensis]|uniref:Uncharacterized protein n=1 Tax=Bursaphelenchus okinawaensis TaxID=465554 RepID=A0A811L742_9BILA|nr:unnamed protein product [Bursaphelenchus okinawaensis]CAG9119149.1 unnamed protein product [Bursaphelenchus okinawaensis]